MRRGAAGGANCRPGCCDLAVAADDDDGLAAATAASARSRRRKIRRRRNRRHDGLRRRGRRRHGGRHRHDPATAAAMLLRKRGRRDERDARRQDRKGEFAHANILCFGPRRTREMSGNYPTPWRAPLPSLGARRCANSRQPASSAASNRAASGLSRSITPSRTPLTRSARPAPNGYAASQAIWPGKAWTSSTRCGCNVAAAAPHTPLPNGMRMQAARP